MRCSTYSVPDLLTYKALVPSAGNTFMLHAFTSSRGVGCGGGGGGLVSCLVFFFCSHFKISLLSPQHIFTHNKLLYNYMYIKGLF